ncbi:MAG: hypothetical protein QOH97_3213 [Actinoplanes sp.]|jgi:hypothetical protein|nr:hypothetical protein [Actinoplanes sp.]
MRRARATTASQVEFGEAEMGGGLGLVVSGGTSRGEGGLRSSGPGRDTHRQGEVATQAVGEKAGQLMVACLARL